MNIMTRIFFCFKWDKTLILFTFHLGLISKTIEQSNVPHINLNMQMAAGLPLSLFEFLQEKFTFLTCLEKA